MGGRVPRTQRLRVRPGEGWAPPGCTLPKTHHDDNIQPYHTGSVAARVNKDRAFRRTPGRRCQMCYWCIIEDSRKRQHHHRHLEHKDTKSRRETSGTNTRNEYVRLCTELSTPSDGFCVNVSKMINILDNWENSREHYNFAGCLRVPRF